MLHDKVYGLYWQEDVIPGDHLKMPEANSAGAYLTPVVNKIANQMTGFDRQKADPAFQNSNNVYPGDTNCSLHEAHSKWLEGAANAFVDVAFLADSASKIIGGGQLKLAGESKLLDCYMAPDAFSASETSDWVALMNESSTAFETCFSTFLKGWPSLNVGEFLSCMVTSFIANVYGTERSESLDGCLVQNQCIAFNGIDLDIPKLIDCIGLTNIVSRACVHMTTFALRGPSFSSSNSF